MFITSMSQVKKLTPAEILGGFKNTAATLPTKSYAELMTEIAKLEKLAAIAMATETFLDCEYKKVKVSKRIARVPKYARSITK